MLRFQMIVAGIHAAMIFSPPLFGSVGTVDEPSPQQVLDLAPRISLNNPEIRAFRFAGHAKLGDGMQFAFDVAAERPSHLAIVITDPDDQTPYFVAIERHTLLYDAPKLRVFAGDHTSATFIAKRDNGKMDIRWIVDNGKDDDVQIDLFSFFTGLPLSCDHEPDGTLTLKGVSPKGVTVTARVDLRDKRSPYKAVLETKAGDANPFLSIDKIVINAPLPPVLWRFPRFESLLSSNFTLQPYREFALERNYTAALPVIYRGMLRDPTGRPKWEQQFGPVDWERAKRQDAKVTQALREKYYGSLAG
jgi:hypothetical protein